DCRGKRPRNERGATMEPVPIRVFLVEDDEDDYILLIDDNPEDRLLTRRELTQVVPQLQIIEVKEQQELGPILQAGGFDVVITDYHLGWSTGLAILESVKMHLPRCPVLMFTATGSEEVAVEAMKAGLDDYILKSPKHFIRLSAAVRSALDR